jgi:predicted site-specific integrase-resolvase
MDRLLTTTQVGQALGLSADWARRQAAAGAFGPTYRVGGKVRIPEPGVQAYLNQRVQQQVQVETAVTGNRVVDEIHRRRQQRRSA